MIRSAARPLLTAVLVVVLASCGGGADGPSGPPAVATVAVSVLSPTLTVGQAEQLTVTVTDVKGNPSSSAVAYTTSAPEIASISTTGNISGVAPGTATLTATAGGHSGSVNLTVIQVPVSGLLIVPRSVKLRIGDTTSLKVTPVDITGASLTGRTVTFLSADPTRATVTSAGLVTAVSGGSVYIRVQSEVVTDSALVQVRNLNAPIITGASPAMLLPGTPGTITGSNFSATAADVQVLVNGVSAPVTSVSLTSVAFTVPSAQSLPCSATGPVPLAIVVNGDTTATTQPLTVATPRTLAVGQSMLLTTASDIACNEFPQTSGRFMFTVFNYGIAATSTVAFRVDGAAPAGSTPVASRVPAFVRRPSFAMNGPVGPGPAIDPRTVAISRGALAAHERVMDLNERVLRAHPHAVGAIRAAKRARASLSVQAAVPVVGDIRTFKVIKSLTGSLSNYDSLRARVVYVGPKMVIYEDSLAPLAGTMDADYQEIGAEFDAKMWPIINEFGDPLILDAQLSNAGRVTAIFSNRINALSAGLLGFVGAWDFFPATGADGIAASNEGEYFYAVVPDPAKPNFLPDPALWKRYLRGVLAHEAKHIVGFAEHIAIDADSFEDRWLEEATAQMSSEMWSRQVYGHGWKSNIAWLDGPRCDYVNPLSGSCTDNPHAIALHFDWLYSFMLGNERKSVLTQSSSDGASLYGGGWLFTRWLTDWYSNGDEAGFVHSLVVQQHDVGVANVVARTGKPFSELFGLWSLATMVDDLALPGFTPTDPHLTMPSWNVRDMFAGMNTLHFTDGTPAYPNIFPLGTRPLSYGSFAAQATSINALPGGAFAAFDLSGTQHGSQTIGVRDANGNFPTANTLGVAIVRVQ